MEAKHQKRTPHLKLYCRQDQEWSLYVLVKSNNHEVLYCQRLLDMSYVGLTKFKFWNQVETNSCFVVGCRSALQTLHKVSSKARDHNYFLGGLTHEWVSYYEQRIESDRSCLNEWHAMDSLESRRPPSPDSLRSKSVPTQLTQTYFTLGQRSIMYNRV